MVFTTASSILIGNNPAILPPLAFDHLGENITASGTSAARPAATDEGGVTGVEGRALEPAYSAF